MNVYDAAHKLANAIKDSEEFKEYKKAEAEIQKNESLNNMIKDFQTKSMEIQLKQMAGEELDKESTEKIQQLYGIVMQDPNAASFLQSNMRFSLMMKDVYEILGEATGDK